jgi:hypothetical protein
MISNNVENSLKVDCDFFKILFIMIMLLKWVVDPQMPFSKNLAHIKMF